MIGRNTLLGLYNWQEYLTLPICLAGIPYSAYLIAEMSYSAYMIGRDVLLSLYDWQEYSRNCLKQPTKGQAKSGCIRQLAAYDWQRCLTRLDMIGRNTLLSLYDWQEYLTQPI